MEILFIRLNLYMKKSLKELFSLRRKSYNFQNIPTEAKIKLFDSLMRPKLTYGTELWMCGYNCNANKSDSLRK